MAKGGGRGFAGMDEQKQREIASKGGKEAHRKGTAHEFTSEEAAEAGRKGGQARGAARRLAAEPAARQQMAQEKSQEQHVQGSENQGCEQNLEGSC
ncbi:MAG TPA: KGG domain-containing protein [Candidatus Obscuribacterales bacterium]